ncbi:hypothetical protein GEMRC1_004418 [Eukaryota sp. GEM-RC1]
MSDSTRGFRTALKDITNIFGSTRRTYRKSFKTPPHSRPTADFFQNSASSFNSLSLLSPNRPALSADDLLSPLHTPTTGTVSDNEESLMDMSPVQTPHAPQSLQELLQSLEPSDSPSVTSSKAVKSLVLTLDDLIGDDLVDNHFIGDDELLIDNDLTADDDLLITDTRDMDMNYFDFDVFPQELAVFKLLKLDFDCFESEMKMFNIQCLSYLDFDSFHVVSDLIDDDFIDPQSDDDVLGKRLTSDLELEFPDFKKLRMLERRCGFFSSPLTCIALPVKSLRTTHSLKRLKVTTKQPKAKVSWLSVYDDVIM